MADPEHARTCKFCQQTIVFKAIGGEWHWRADDDPVCVVAFTHYPTKPVEGIDF